MPINLSQLVLYLSGIDADGTPPTANPILMAGQDGTNVQSLKTNATGQLEVDIVSGGGTGGLTDAELRAAPVPVVTQEPISVDDNGGSLTVDGPLTDAQLRAAVVPIAIDQTGNNNAVDVLTSALPTGAATAANQQTDALTDTELRATPVPVSGTVSVTEPVSIDDNGGSITVDGPVTDTQLRASPVPVSLSSDIEIGAVELKNGTDDTRATVTAANALKVDGSAVTQPVSAASLPLPTGAATAANQQTDALTDAELRASPVPVSGTVAATLSEPISVDDNGGSLTVDGSVTANAGTNLNTSALALESGGNLAAIAASASVLDDWDESDRAKVNPIAGQAGVQGNTGTVNALTQRVVLATDVALPAGTNAIGKLAANSGVDIGDVDVTSLPAIPAGSNLIGKVNNVPLATDGCDIFRSLDLDETEEEVKATAGTIYGWAITNRRTSTIWFKVYNATAANVTVGTTTPVITWGIPGNSTDNVAANMLGGVGIKLDTAITVAATTGFADADTGAPAANDCIVNIFYK